MKLFAMYGLKGFGFDDMIQYRKYDVIENLLYGIKYETVKKRR